jgi:hypothetical protein
MRMLKPALILALAALSLGGCAQRLEAPMDRGVCYHLAFGKDGKPRFNRVAENMPNIENCAAQLEGMRLRFARMGSYQNAMVGSYQGNFLFIERAGIFTAKHYDGVRYLALVRTGDGRLVQPGAMPSY